MRDIAFSEEELELKDLLKVLKWWWLILACAVLFAIAALLFSLLMTPVYRASSVISIEQASSAKVTYQDILASQRLVESYAQMLKSKPLLEETSELLDLPSINPKNVSVTPVRNTQLIKIRVENKLPSVAARIANMLPQVFAKDLHEKENRRFKASEQTLQKELSAIKQQMSEVQAQIDALGKDSTQKALDRKVHLEAALAQYRSSYASLLKEYESVRMAEANQSTWVNVVEPAEVPEAPFRPRTKLNVLLGAVVGAMIGTGGAFLLEYLNNTVRGEEDVKEYIGLPILAKINKFQGGNGNELISAKDSKSPVTESFRVLRTSIRFSGVDSPLKAILVTGAEPSGGKSVVSSNLAVVMAYSGEKVVVVDADLRRPSIHSIFKVPNGAGLTNLLADPDWEENLHSYLANGVGSVKVLTSGFIPPNPAELLGSKKFRKVLERLSEEFDIVVIDSPPVMLFADTLAIAPVVDGVIFTLAVGETDISSARESVENLQKVGANLLGVVLNKVPVNRRGHYSYYYYYHSDEASGTK